MFVCVHKKTNKEVMKHTKGPFRLHIISNPKIPSSKQYSTDAYTQFAMKLSKMFTERNHHVYFYGIRGFESDVICSKYVRFQIECHIDTNFVVFQVSVVEFDMYEQLQIETKDFTDPSLMVSDQHPSYKSIAESIQFTFGKAVANVLKRLYQKGSKSFILLYKTILVMEIQEILL